MKKNCLIASIVTLNISFSCNVFLTFFSIHFLSCFALFTLWAKGLTSRVANSWGGSDYERSCLAVTDSSGDEPLKIFLLRKYGPFSSCSGAHSFVAKCVCSASSGDCWQRWSWWSQCWGRQAEDWSSVSCQRVCCIRSFVSGRVRG